MNHLSVRTRQLPREVVGAFKCSYKMGDNFVSTISEVNCPTCLDQIKIATGK